MAKNIDYTQSAEQLTNPESVRLLLVKRLGLNSKLAELQEELEVQNASLLTEIDALRTELAINETAIKNTILDDGGYQDVDAGLYALRQKRVSVTYDPGLFKTVYPMYAPAVIKEVVDVDKLNGLLKGGLLTRTGLLDFSISTEKPSFAFIIRADPQTEVREK